MLGLGASGSLSWILKPGMSMYLGLGTSVCWLIFLCSVFKAWDGFRNGKFRIGATVACILGFFGTVGCMIYGGNIPEVRGPLIYAIWAILSCLAMTLITLFVKFIMHIVSNGKSKSDETVEIVQESRRLMMNNQYEREKLETNLRESGRLASQAGYSNQQSQYGNQQAQPQQNPYGNQQQQPQQNPYGNRPQQNPYGNQQQHPYGNRQPQPQQNPYGNQKPQQNSYGNRQNPYGNQQHQNPYGNRQPQQQQNPYGNRQPQQQNPYGNQQTPQRPQRPNSPYDQQHYGTGSIDITGRSKKSGFIGK